MIDQYDPALQYGFSLLDLMLMELMEREPWRAKANCRGVDPEIFFPSKGDRLDEARAICRGCMVATECGQHALEAGEDFGVWGGLANRERRRIRRQRKAA